MRRTMNTGILALVGVGLYYAWQNRFRIQQFLESQGINTALDTSSIGNTIRSGVAKISGQIQNDVNTSTGLGSDLGSDVRRAV